MLALWRLPSRIALLVVRGYQVLISPMLPPACRFTPSCSHYACACLLDHGFVRGSWLTLRRLSRCHPWHPGGYDPPPPQRANRVLGSPNSLDPSSRLDPNMPRTTTSPITSELARETSP
ncbi:membrane protein insertion efficiency factor YidD [Nannocystaceae bacterium ST9]